MFIIGDIDEARIRVDSLGGLAKLGILVSNSPAITDLDGLEARRILGKLRQSRSGSSQYSE